jgi:hypothetical protein
MNEENTESEAQKQQNEKLLRLMTGYCQHASPLQPNTTTLALLKLNTITVSPNIINVLIQMKADNKSGYTINFTRKALTFLSQHASLAEPEAAKLFIATHKASGRLQEKSLHSLQQVLQILQNRMDYAPVSSRSKKHQATGKGETAYADSQSKNTTIN